MAGDFNEVLLGEDKFGGRLVNIQRVLKFQDCLNSYGMIDLGFSGPRLTWSNNRPLSQLVQERIDRVFVTPDWSNLTWKHVSSTLREATLITAQWFFLFKANLV